MKEIAGDIWDFHSKGHWIVITTNGSVKKNGACVMGRGVALQAARELPDLPYQVGQQIRRYGNQTFAFPQYRIFTFPVKFNWWEKADSNLIEESCKQLSRSSISTGIYMVRPGWGNGGLNWLDVKPILERYLDDGFIVVEKA
jgi:hypothetical protein